MRKTLLALSIMLFVACQQGGESMKKISLEQLKVEAVIERLQQLHGADQAMRIKQGVNQVARLWRAEDGSAEDFAQFCEEHFVADNATLEEITHRFDQNLEQIYGLNNAMSRELQRQMQLDIGPLYPVDMLFANFDPFAHLTDDFFQTKIAFAALLNFPLYTLDEILKISGNWSRLEWAQARLAQRFDTRVPAAVNQKISEVMVAADHYISNYNIYMHHLVSAEGERYFPEGLKLISHWGLRDELKSQYAKTDGLKRQQMIQQVMERIVRQEIPAVVIDNPSVDWEPVSNNVQPTALDDSKKSAEVKETPEDNVRYRHLLHVFQAERLADPYHPDMPTLIDRRFQHDREIPEKEFESLLISILSAPVAKDVAQLIKKRVGRELEPFDIWYDGFKARGTIDEAKLDEIVAQRYPTIAAFQADLPFILRNLGFSPETASFLSTKITVDPARGAGHAAGAEMRSDNAHLRTRIPATGMNYKAFNIAIHELGHNVEQVFSLNRVDYTMLQGVPNTAFTEGFAFVFQSRDLSLLGIGQSDPNIEYLNALDNYWSTFEISGVALVDMYVWHWMYDHPQASAAELNQAVQQIAIDVWNKYYAPVLGMSDQILLGIYSHMIDAALYLPDYPLGHIISFQIEEYFRDKDLATEMERMCRLGSITPSAWMQAAVGAPISTEPLILAGSKAVQALQ